MRWKINSLVISMYVKQRDDGMTQNIRQCCYGHYGTTCKAHWKKWNILGRKHFVFLPINLSLPSVVQYIQRLVKTHHLLFYSKCLHLPLIPKDVNKW